MKIKYLFKKIVFTCLVFVLPLVVFGAPVTVTNPLGVTSVQGLITNMINAVLSIVGAVALAMLIYGGVLIMISGGEQERYDSGKKTITYAVVGLIVVILSYSIMKFIVSAITG